jgi:chaperone BCS1
MSKSVSGKVSLSSLLNVINSIGLQEGQILIMTTNYITCLDKALIRPGHVDKKIELGLTNNKIIANLFYLVFKPVEGDVTLLENA